MEDIPLLDNSDRGKRPLILYIIIGILSLAVIILIIVIVTKKCPECQCPQCPKEEEKTYPYDTSHFIPVKESFYTNIIKGSAAFQGKLNHFDSPYFKMVDVYNMKSNENRTIFTNFKTYQQTSEYSSECAAIIMALTYYGDQAPSEKSCMAFFGATDPDNFVESEAFYQNISMKNIENYINSLGYNTTSNDNFTEQNFPYSNSSTFSSWILEVLKKNETILINWSDWGATISIVIGLDTMGHDYPDEQVIILADTYDTGDHLNDGYYILSLDKFYLNWKLNKIHYFNSTNIKYATGRFIIIHRKDGN